MGQHASVATAVLRKQKHKTNIKIVGAHGLGWFVRGESSRFSFFQLRNFSSCTTASWLARHLHQLFPNLLKCPNEGAQLQPVVRCRGAAVLHIAKLDKKMA